MSSTTRKPLVITLHGFLGQSRLFFRIRSALERAGYNVRDFNYPMKLSLPLCGQALAEFTEEARRQTGASSVHFVGHSLGGIVIRAALSQASCPVELKTGRVVQIAPPNLGSEFGRRIASVPVLRQSLLRLADALTDIEKQKPRPTTQATVMASELRELSAGHDVLSREPDFFASNFLFPSTLAGILVIRGSFPNPLLPGRSDGTVAHAETAVPIPPNDPSWRVPITELDLSGQHTVLLLLNPTVRAVVRFLDSGRVA